MQAEANRHPSRSKRIRIFAIRNWIPLCFFTLVAGMLLYLLILPAIAFALYQPREGDLIFQSLPMGALTATIEGATHSPYSHVGIVTKDEKGDWQVWEAYGSVGAIPLSSFWMRGRRLNFRVFRFNKSAQADNAVIVEQVKTYQGLPYDTQYELDDEKIYCSELIYKAYGDLTGKPLGKLQKLGEMNWEPYLKVIKAIEPGDPPLERQIISPKSLSEASELTRAVGYGI